MCKDTRLRYKVLSELNWDPGLIATHIEVSALGGIITLTGHVGTSAEWHAAAAAACRMAGVTSIVQAITVTG